jgi:hypothetical protein
MTDSYVLNRSPATDGDQGATLTPVSNLAVGELIPVFPGSCIAMTTTDEEDSLSVPSYSEVIITPLFIK